MAAAVVIDQDIKPVDGIFTAVVSFTKPLNLRSICFSIVCLALVLRLYHTILNDYNNFLALGPGGTPSTFTGYLRVSYLRLFALRDPFQPPSLAQAFYPCKSYLRNLPQRSGPRPEVAGIAPQRQITQKCSCKLHLALRKALLDLVEANPLLLQKGNSCFEKHGLALFMAASQTCPMVEQLNPTCKNTGEICHLHATVSPSLPHIFSNIRFFPISFPAPHPPPQKKNRRALP